MPEDDRAPSQTTGTAADSRGASSFFAKLRQRHMVRAAIIYAAAVWAIAQGIAQLSPTFGMAPMVTWWFVIACAIGFPFWLVFAWYFKFTAGRIAREGDAVKDATAVRRSGRQLDFSIIGIMAVAIVLLLTNQLVLQRGKTMREFAGTAAPGAMTTIPAQSIAVLPFENLSADKQNAYFAAGIQDLILTKLADIGGVKVIARTSTMQYQSRPADLETIRRQLGVATILEGSVQKAGNEVLINVQLIDTKTDAHLWAQAYTRTLDDVFGVEGEVAQKIARSLHATLSPEQTASLARAPTTNKVAYDLFLRGEYQFNRRLINGGNSSRSAAILLYRQAVARDPAFALAWARLSMAESNLAFNRGAGWNVAQLKRRAQADAERALKLQPELPAAQLALGYSAYWGHRNYTAALKAFEAVLARQPNDADALAAQAYVQRRQGRIKDALSSLSRAAALDPRNFNLILNLAGMYMAVPNYTEAESWCQRALALEPDSYNAKSNCASAVLYGRGDIPRALALIQGHDPRLEIVRAQLLAYQRRFPEAIALLQSVPDTPDNFAPGQSKAGQLGIYYWQAGDRGKARALFAKALPQDRAALARAQGIDKAGNWISVAADELGSGHATVALAAIARSQAIIDRVRDAGSVPIYRLDGAMTYAMATRADRAVPLLAKVLATPGVGEYYAPVMLWLDPAWDPIRRDPGFQALLKKYAKYKPAVTYTAVSGGGTSTN